MRCGFFVQSGISVSDTPYLRGLCLRLSAAGYGDMGYFMGLPVEELKEVVEEAGRIAKERKKALKKRS